jgi:hypothetical protein
MRFQRRLNSNVEVPRLGAIPQLADARRQLRNQVDESLHQRVRVLLIRISKFEARSEKPPLTAYVENTDSSAEGGGKRF